MSVIIRPAVIEDAHAIAEAERDIAQTPGLFCSTPTELTDENVVNTITDFLNNQTGAYFVAECEAGIVGHAFLETKNIQSLAHIAELNIAVHLGWQQKGIGRQLLIHLIEWAKNSGRIEKIELNVRASNIAAISLYKQVGFQEEGRLKNRVKIKDYYIDDIVMGLDLRDR